MTISNSVKLFTASIVAGTMFLGCGSDDNTTAAAPAVQTGTFVDAPVKGLKFKSATQEGITNENGEFTYVNGEDVEFFLGTLSFGSVQGQTLVTPYTMAGVGIGEQNNKATNIALLLQNFDANQSDSTILDVSLLRDHNFSGITLGDTPVTMETTIGSLFSESSLSHYSGYTLKSTDEVKEVMDNYLDTLNNVQEEEMISIESGYSEAWLNGRTLYLVITDTEDDDNDGSTTDKLIVAMKFENGNLSYDFSADGTFEATEIVYEVENGVLIKREEGDTEYQTLTNIDNTKITSTFTASWTSKAETIFEFFTKENAQNYIDSL